LFFKRRVEAPLPVVLETSGTPETPETPEMVVVRTMSTDRALWRLGSRGLEIATVSDVGASNGMWCAICEKYHPASNYPLMEAQEAHRASLAAYTALRPKAEYVLAVAGDRITPGVLLFDEIIVYKRGLGFGAIDMSEPLWRERDLALWQIDLFFASLDRPGFRTLGFC
jgi:hypothetical protein